MSIKKKLSHRWIPLAFVPFFSVAVLSSCGSDDDDDTPVGADTAGADTAGADTAGSDTDGTDTAGTDTAGTDTAGADTAGTDTAGADTAGTDTAGADTAGTDTAGTDTAGTDTGGSATTGGDTDAGGEPVTDFGPLVIGDNQGSVDLEFDGTNLTGTVDVVLEQGVGVAAAFLDAGIAAAGQPGVPVIQLNGSAPTFFVPTGIAPDDLSNIQQQLDSGNLFVRIDTTDGQQLRSDQLLPPGGAVTALFTNLEVPTGSGLFATGAAFLNINSETGGFSAALNVNLNASDTDLDGVAITAAAANIHETSPTGPVIVPLIDSGNGTAFTATGTLSDIDLETILSNNGWFNVQQNDGNTPGASFLAGQIMFVQ